MDRILQHFSLWYRLKKCIAWILRYGSKLLLTSRRRKLGQEVTVSGNAANPLSIEEMNFAEVEILKYIQRQSYGKELSTLKDGQRHNNKEKSQRPEVTSVKKSSCIYKLDPVLVDGLLRTVDALAVH